MQRMEFLFFVSKIEKGSSEFLQKRVIHENIYNY